MRKIPGYIAVEVPFSFSIRSLLRRKMEGKYYRFDGGNTKLQRSDDCGYYPGAFRSGWYQHLIRGG